jgi:hypothetical protein
MPEPSAAATLPKPSQMKQVRARHVCYAYVCAIARKPHVERARVTALLHPLRETLLTAAPTMPTRNALLCLFTFRREQQEAGGT